MPDIGLHDIHFDTSIYPREKWRTSTVSRYVDCLKRGDQFPPLVIEEDTNRLLDGVHRWKAYIEYQEMHEKRSAQENLVDTEYDSKDDWADPLERVPVEYQKIPDGIPPKLYAAMLSVTHGDRITNAERQAIAREIYQANPDFTLEELQAYLHISKSTAGEYVKDIRARRRETQKITAYRLHRLGWTQDEIAGAVGVTRDQFTRGILCNFPDLEKHTEKLISDGIPHLDVAERFNLPLILVHAIDLHGKDDLARMKALGITPQPYDVWNFSKCHDLFGNDWPGRIPGQLVAQVLKQFTKPGDCVIDPMAGSGTTLDVCLAFNRKCYAYDMNLESNRPDVIEHNILEDGWPERTKKADLIFWDPPYFDKKDKEYMDGGISSMGRDEYLKFFHDRFTEAYEIVKKGAQLVFLMSPWDDPDDESNIISVRDYANLMEKSGWSIRREIHCPLSTQQVHPDIVNKFNLSNRQTRLARAITRGVKV